MVPSGDCREKDIKAKGSGLFLEKAGAIRHLPPRRNSRTRCHLRGRGEEPERKHGPRKGPSEGRAKDATWKSRDRVGGGPSSSLHTHTCDEVPSHPFHERRKTK
ncbi:hypothetical protein CEXT_297301 [Caerostris extrusa]|uniref:Uncharacterized protein n=1 Tax=Caerostris extrusa TaxID=172846 RepID=A0AAV4MFQ7_CAEEX|nr:hypothetical protein CEXT_297301 [Caerostris extrusa]